MINYDTLKITFPNYHFIFNPHFHIYIYFPMTKYDKPSFQFC